MICMMVIIITIIMNVMMLQYRGDVLEMLWCCVEMC